MIGKRKSELSAQSANVLVTTADSIPGRQCEIIDVICTASKLDARTHFAQMKNELTTKANSVGADAIIGFRLFSQVENTVGGPALAYGTAVRFINEEGGSE